MTKHQVPAIPLQVDYFEDCILIQRVWVRDHEQFRREAVSFFDGRLGLSEIACVPFTGE